MAKFGGFSFGTGVMFGITSYGDGGQVVTYTNESAATTPDFTPEYSVGVFWGDGLWGDWYWDSSDGSPIATTTYTNESAATRPTYTRVA